MKIFCLIVSISMSDPEGALIRSQKPFESLLMCQAWKHQEEYQPPVGDVLVVYRACIERL